MTVHIRIEIGTWRLQLWRTEPEPDPDPDDTPPIDTPTPQVVSHPDRVGFYLIPDETD